ncbi:hypothetical protein I4U23_005250 [Adineta vaga]|nr:hypothetical protein I4U23_005250 [Adineta vaga]
MASITKITPDVERVPKEQLEYRRLNIQRMQNVVLIWLDSSIDMADEDYQNTIIHFNNPVNTYTSVDQCIEFIRTIEDQKVCILISGYLGQQVIPNIHNMSQMHSIFILCGNKKRHEQWAKEWPKIKGVFTEIEPICDALKQAVHQCEQNAISISFVAMGILFVMTIDPKQSTTAFASIHDISAIEGEDWV